MVDQTPCFVTDLTEEACNLSPLGMVLLGGFLWMSFIRLRKLPFIPSFLIGFIRNGY